MLLSLKVDAIDMQGLYLIMYVFEYKRMDVKVDAIDMQGIHLIMYIFQYKRMEVKVDAHDMQGTENQIQGGCAWNSRWMPL